MNKADKKPIYACSLCSIQACRTGELNAVRHVLADIDSDILQHFLVRNDNAAFALRDLRSHLVDRCHAVEHEISKLLGHEHDGITAERP